MSKAEYRADRNLADAFASESRIQIRHMMNLGLHPNRKLAKGLVMLLYWLHTAVFTLLAPKADKNIFFTQPPLIPLWGWVLSKIRRQPYVCVVMDIYPDLIVAYGMMRPDSWLTKIISRLSIFALKNAESVMVIGRCMHGKLVEMGVPAEKLQLIPNWIDETAVYTIPSSKNPLRTEWKLNNNKFVVLYSGNMGYSHYFNDILAVAQRLQSNEEIVFVFIGGGARYREITDFVKENDLANVQLRPFQPYSLLAQSLSLGDVHLVTLRDSCTGLAVPSKSYGILAVGGTILFQGSEECEIAQMVEEEGIGKRIAVGDVDGLQQAIEFYWQNSDLRCQNSQKSRQLAEGKYGRLQAIQKYSHILINS